MASQLNDKEMYRVVQKWNVLGNSVNISVVREKSTRLEGG